jgi:DNA-binding transcriptional ArsR family regulator
MLPESNFLFEKILGSKTRVRILSVLAREGELSVTMIIKQARTNYKNAVKHLALLQAGNLIEERTFGRIRIFRYKHENLRARALYNLIEIWNETQNDENILNKFSSSDSFY